MKICICGSLRFKQEIIDTHNAISRQGNIALMPIFDVQNISKENLIKIHNEKIKMCDLVVIVDVNGYIGDDTKKEIELAKSLNKRLIFYSGKKE